MIHKLDIFSPRYIPEENIGIFSAQIIHQRNIIVRYCLRERFSQLIDSWVEAVPHHSLASPLVGFGCYIGFLQSERCITEYCSLKSTSRPAAVNFKVWISVICSASARFKIWIVFGPIKLALEAIGETPRLNILVGAFQINSCSPKASSPTRACTEKPEPSWLRVQTSRWESSSFILWSNTLALIPHSS